MYRDELSASSDVDSRDGQKTGKWTVIMRKKQNDCARRAATVTNSMGINSQMTRIYTFQHARGRGSQKVTRGSHRNDVSPLTQTQDLYYRSAYDYRRGPRVAAVTWPCTYSTVYLFHRSLVSSRISYLWLTEYTDHHHSSLYGEYSFPTSLVVQNLSIVSHSLSCRLEANGFPLAACRQVR